MVAHLHHRDLCSHVVQVFGHLQPDKSGTHNHCVLYAARSHVILDAIGVIHITQREDTFRLDTFQRRTHGRRSRRKQQFVVAFGVSRSVRTAHLDAFGGGVDAYDFVLHPHVDIEPSAERSGGLHEKLFPFGDRATYIVR